MIIGKINATPSRKPMNMSHLAQITAITVSLIFIGDAAFALKRTPISHQEAKLNLMGCNAIPGFAMETPSSVGCCFEDDQSDTTYCTMCNKETNDCAEYELIEGHPRDIRKRLQSYSDNLRVAPPAPSTPKPARVPLSAPATTLSNK